MASKVHKLTSPGYVDVNIKIHDQLYHHVKLGVVPNLCCDVLLGQDFQKRLKSLTFKFEGSMPKLEICGKVCALASAHADIPTLFPNIDASCKPIATKSRTYSQSDRKFISDQVSSLLSQGIIRESISPWRAQVVVAKDPFNLHKKRLCIDYSQTINLYTELDCLLYTSDAADE